MHTVCETRAFRTQALDAGMSEAEINDLTDYLASHPAAGTEIPGSGGCRKLRLSGRGKGKSGGYRTITFYSGEMLPVFLLAAFSKGERSNLTQGERNALHGLTKLIVEEYRTRVAKMGEQR